MNPEGAVGPSILDLVVGAPIVVQIVIAGLVVAAIWTWAVAIQKYFQFSKARKEADKFEQVFWSGQSLDELYQALAQRRNVGMASLFVAALREWKRSTERDDGDRARPMPGLQLRVEKIMAVTLGRETGQVGRRLNFLGTVGTAAPYIGLFGVLWGVMASFQAVAAIPNAGLATIAPGIAAALLPGALGLFVAVPAVIFSNKFNGEVKRYGARLERFADEFAAILSRQMDRM